MSLCALVIFAFLRGEGECVEHDTKEGGREREKEKEREREREKRVVIITCSGMAWAGAFDPQPIGGAAAEPPPPLPSNAPLTRDVLRRCDPSGETELGGAARGVARRRLCAPSGSRGAS